VKEKKIFEFFLEKKFHGDEGDEKEKSFSVRGQESGFSGEHCTDRENVRPANDFSAQDGEAAEEVLKWSMPTR